jgi:hypothetical protein
MPRESASSVSIDRNLRCLRVYPAEGTNKSTKDLKTVGLQFSKKQALHLARLLLLVTQQWDTVDITAYRYARRRIDGTYHVTVTSHRA